MYIVLRGGWFFFPHPPPRVCFLSKSLSGKHMGRKSLAEKIYEQVEGARAPAKPTTREAEKIGKAVERSARAHACSS